MITLFSIQDLEQKELFFKLSNAFSLRENAVLSRKVSGLYAIFQDGVCHYVGLSTNLPSRLATHLRGKYASCTTIRVYLPEENGFPDFYERNESARKEILSLNEKALMAYLKPVDNLNIDMDFKLEKGYRFYGLDHVDLEININEIDEKIFCKITEHNAFPLSCPDVYCNEKIGISILELERQQSDDIDWTVNMLKGAKL
jgi:hypothetical protein